MQKYVLNSSKIQSPFQQFGLLAQTDQLNLELSGKRLIRRAWISVRAGRDNNNRHINRIYGGVTFFNDKEENSAARMKGTDLAIPTCQS